MSNICPESLRDSVKHATIIADLHDAQTITTPRRSTRLFFLYKIRVGHCISENKIKRDFDAWNYRRNTTHYPVPTIDNEALL